MNGFKELTDLLKEKEMWNFGWAKPGTIFINQGRRPAAIVCGEELRDYNVAYKMPNGRIYAKIVKAEEARKILDINLNFTLNDEGKLERKFGF